MTFTAASLGELVVELFRPELDEPWDYTGCFLGPYASGAPAIFIDALAKLGCHCHYFATVGQDAFGDFLIKKLNADGVDTGGVARVSSTTGIALSTFYSDGSRRYIYHLGNAAPGLFGKDFLNHEILSHTDFLHISANVLAFSDSAKEACYQAVQEITSGGGKVSFDPNIRPEVMSQEDVWRLCSPVIEKAYVVLPSGTEARMLTGAKDDVSACLKLVDMGIPYIALKEARAGSSVFTRDSQVHAPAYQVDEVDPTGAGDCYDAGFVYGLLQDWEPKKCAQFANALGALTVRVRGPMEGFKSLSDVTNFMESTPTIET